MLVNTVVSVCVWGGGGGGAGAHTTCPIHLSSHLPVICHQQPAQVPRDQKARVKISRFSDMRKQGFLRQPCTWGWNLPHLGLSLHPPDQGKWHVHFFLVLSQIFKRPDAVIAIHYQLDRNVVKL